MQGSFEASLPQRVARSSRVSLQNVIPSHWFSAAASECYEMYVAGYFYGTISIAQAYVETLSQYLCQLYKIRGSKNNAVDRWIRLQREKLVGLDACGAAIAVLSDRNDFHHLNTAVEQEHTKLETRAEECMNMLHRIESDVFAHTFDNGQVVLARPERWPAAGEGLVRIQLRNK